MTVGTLPFTAPRSSTRVAADAGETRMPERSRFGGYAPVVAAVAWFAVFAAGAISVMHCLGRDFAPLPLSFARGPLALFSLVAGALSFATFGALLASRIPRNPVGWLLLGIGAVIGMIPLTSTLVASALEVLRPAPAMTVGLAWLTSSAATPFALALLIAVLLVFPDGRPLAGRWSIGLWLAAAGALLLTAGTGLSSNGLLWYPALANPVALDPGLDGLLAAVRVGSAALLVAALLVAIDSIVIRYRHCGPTVRRQLRWMVASAVALGATLGPFVIARYAFSVSDTAGEDLTALAAVAACVFPAVTAAAISSYRLVEVDLLISRTLVYVPLMAVLGGMYSAMLVLFGRAFVAFTGNTSDAAAVVTALIVASAFTPVRRTLESVVESRLGRSRLDGARLAEPSADEGEACLNADLLASRLQGLESRLRKLEHPRVRRPATARHRHPAPQS